MGLATRTAPRRDNHRPRTQGAEVYGWFTREGFASREGRQVVSRLGEAFVRVSSGQPGRVITAQGYCRHAAEREITIVKTFRLHGYSASLGTQEPALREAMADIQRGEYSALIV